MRHRARIAAGRAFSTVGVALLLTASLPLGARTATAQPAPINPHTMSAAEFVRRVQAGETIDEQNLIVSGDVNLGSVGTVTRPIRCLNCDFRGRFDAPDVIFDRIVVLSGAHFFGQLDLRGAEFKDRFIVRRSSRASMFDQFSLFSFATFDDTAAFDESTFKIEGNFTSARFLGDASFAETNFLQHARFNQTAFGGQALFTSSGVGGHTRSPGPCGAPVNGTVRGQSIFTRAVFAGVADFRQRCFGGLADFSGATFESRANFSLATFASGARFDDTGFQGDGQFLATRFRQPFSFARASASRSMDFEDAVFAQDATFEGMAVSGSLSVDGSTFRGRVDLDRIIAGSLMMDVASVGRVTGVDTRARVLAMIETSDRIRGDLHSANDARYQLLSLENQRSSGAKRWIDAVFYRAVAGYLVRPLHPLIAFAILLAAFALVRAALRRRHDRRSRRQRRSAQTKADGPPARRGHQPRRKLRAAPLAIVKWLSAFFEGLGDTVSAAFRRKPQVQLEDREQVRTYLVAAVVWSEYLLFKVLIALFLLGLANSNATLRQLLDSVTG